MNNNRISLEISDNSNLKIMKLVDTSFYLKDEIVTNYMIEVLPVNSNKWVVFNVAKNFSLILNSSNLRYKFATQPSDLIDLPDGIYEIKQSYRPNLQTLSHFYHLRIQELSNTIQRERFKLLNEKCSLSKRELWLNRDKLRDIEEYALAAKWAVEECADKCKGMELYEFAKKLLETYTNECQC